MQHVEKFAMGGVTFFFVFLFKYIQKTNPFFNPPGGLREGYYIGGHAAIILFDVTNRMSYKSVAIWYRDITRVCPDIPIVLCGNKVDVKNREVKPKQIIFHRKKCLQYYDISVKSNYNYEKPFVYLIRRLFSDPALVLTKPPAVYPAEVAVDKEQIKEAEKEMELAAMQPLPDEDDEDFPLK